MLRVRCRRCDLRVLVSRRHALLRDWGEVVAMNEVVRNAGVGGIFFVERLENFDRFQQRLHALVVEHLVQRQRMEDLCLHIARILHGERIHCVLVITGASVLVHLFEILVELPDCRQPVALALGLGADRDAFFDCVESPLQGCRVPRAHQRVRSCAHRDAPVRYRTSRVGLGNRRECLHGFGKSERVKHGQRTLELHLRGW